MNAIDITPDRKALSIMATLFAREIESAETNAFRARDIGARLRKFGRPTLSRLTEQDAATINGILERDGGRDATRILRRHQRAGLAGWESMFVQEFNLLCVMLDVFAASEDQRRSELSVALDECRRCMAPSA